MPSGLDAQQQLDFCTDYLYGRWGLKIAQGMGDGEYSPYRVYINNVLTQVRKGMSTGIRGPIQNNGYTKIISTSLTYIITYQRRRIPVVQNRIQCSLII